MVDLVLVETGSGGDLILVGNDILSTDTFCNQVYLALFGGNIDDADQDREESTTGQQNFDFWGNKLFFEFDKSKHFVSVTERKLYEISLDSKGRQELQQAVIRDLRYMDEFANINVSVAITGNDRLEIRVELLEPENVENQSFIYLWDNAKQSGVICGNDLNYQLLLEQINISADFNNDFNDDFSI